jgi:hypothetical protein
MDEPNIDLIVIKELLDSLISKVEENSNESNSVQNISPSLKRKNETCDKEDATSIPEKQQKFIINNMTKKEKDATIKSDVWSNVSEALFNNRMQLFKDMFIQNCKCIELAEPINLTAKDKTATTSESSSDEDSIFTTNSSTSISSASATEAPAKRKRQPCYKNYTTTLCRDCLKGKMEHDETDVSTCRFIGWRKLKPIPTVNNSNGNKYRDMGFLELDDVSEADTSLWSLQNSVKKKEDMSEEDINNCEKMMCFLQKNFTRILDYENNMKLKYSNSKYEKSPHLS